MVFCDGEHLQMCQVADDREGWAAVLFRDASGQPVLFDDHYVTEIRRGTITFQFTTEDYRRQAEAAQ